MFEPDNDTERALVRASREPAGNLLAGRLLDATLRTGIPITVAKRGFFSKLFR